MSADKTSEEGIKQTSTLPEISATPAANHDISPLLDEHAVLSLNVITEGYPRIARAIELMWGSPDMDDYFRALVIDDRRDRSGFPQEILGAILKLSVEHGKRFKFVRDDASSDVWGADPFYRHAFH